MLLESLKEEFVFHCQSRRLSEQTVLNYSRQINYLLQYLNDESGITMVGEVQSMHIKAFLVKMQKAGRKANYLNDLLKAFRVMFRYAYEEGYTQELITEKIKNVRGGKVIIRTFSDDEMKRLANFYRGNDYLSIRNKTIMLMLLDTGIRIGELIGLTEEQIKTDHIIIRGKGRKERVVPKSPALGKWLMKYTHVRESYFLYKYVPTTLFLSRTGKQLTNSMVDRVIKDAGRECDIAIDVRISAHTFRHTYAQYQLRNGLDIYTLSRLLGHENISITQTYLNGIRDNEVLSQGRKSSPLMNL
ncbi:tyrosine-type recombinase/integrase [Christensenellaceae bacterium OttesenSCG-928-K19]|nr:tyrosine-type recombinase/integrase [Christensenellaceae bacterium OttesenSCG-928-K19]